MRCQLCGYEFDAGHMACHTACPMGSHCSLICCPNCGYQVVDETKSTLARLFRRLWPPSIKELPPQPRRPGLKQTGQPAVPLTHIPTGREVEIQGLGNISAGRLAKLSVFGLTPGGRVEILQRRPAPVIRIGETELALAEEILEQIWVHP